jgi:hypothetical protein
MNPLLLQSAHGIDGLLSHLSTARRGARNHSEGWQIKGDVMTL